MGRLLRILALSGALVGAGGCYTYQVVDAPPLGSAVRVHVPVTTNSPLHGQREESVAIEGNLLQGGDTIALATETRRELGAYRELVHFDTLRLASSQITGMEVRQFSTGRSVGLGLAIAAAATTAGAFAFGLGGGSGGHPSPGPDGPVGAVVSWSLVSDILGVLGGH